MAEDHPYYYYGFTILMALSALFWPFWLTASFFILGVFAFRNFYPGLLILFVMDAVYSFETVKVGPWFGSVFIFGVIAYFLVGFLAEKVLRIRR